jgi:hypothetical protein
MSKENVATLCLLLFIIALGGWYSIYIPFLKPHPTDLDQMTVVGTMLAVGLAARDSYRIIRYGKA